jgi:hypothetical protein
VPIRSSGSAQPPVRRLLSDLAGEAAPQPFDEPLDRFRAAAVRLHNAATGLHDEGCLSRAPADLHGSLMHLHLNRLLGADHATERRVYGLLYRLHMASHCKTEGLE